MPRFDIIVVGGGPAGAVSALACSRLGLSVLLIERGASGRHKPCGGVLPPACADLLSEALGLSIPESVMSSPRTLGLYYVPPSGRRNSGSVRRYKLLNINRDLFDRWLCGVAEGSGAEVWYETELLDLRPSGGNRILAKGNAGTIEAEARYIVGADGVYSKVRRQLYKRGMKAFSIVQEHYEGQGDFGDYFYTFFRGEVSPTYAYVIPKDGLFVIGLGSSGTDPTPMHTRVERFKAWLAEEFAFRPISLERREAWAIPDGSVALGEGDVVLAGDAAGFCNPLSGEGVRLAIESGIAVGEALKDAIENGRPIVESYQERVEWIALLVHEFRRFTSSLTDEDREKFVKSELNRIPLQRS